MPLARFALCLSFALIVGACAPAGPAASDAADAAPDSVVFDDASPEDAPPSDARAVTDAARCLTCIPTSREAGISYSTTESPWPAGAVCLNAARPGGIAKEILMGATKTVVIASPPREISDAAWATYAPPLPNIKNSDRHLLFERSCFSRSPSRPATCIGDECREVVTLGDFTWTALSQIEAADCLPDASACAGTSARNGGLLVVVTRKCHELIFEGSVYFLEGPSGERAVMHATADGTPTMGVALPPGWTLRQETLSAPLVVHPFGGGDRCYYNILRDARAQSYHQIRYARPTYP